MNKITRKITNKMAFSFIESRWKLCIFFKEIYLNLQKLKAIIRDRLVLFNGLCCRSKQEFVRRLKRTQLLEKIKRQTIKKLHRSTHTLILNPKRIMYSYRCQKWLERSDQVCTFDADRQTNRSEVFKLIDIYSQGMFTDISLSERRHINLQTL